MDQPAKTKPPEGAALLEALVKSARRGARDTLRSRISLARTARNDAAMAVFFKERSDAKREHLIPRDGMHRVYDAALAAAVAAAEAIMAAAIEAGAKDGPIAAYVTHDFARSVDAHMMSGFGHRRGGDGAFFKRQLVGLEHNTRAKSALLAHRVRVLRDEYEKTCPTAYDRMVRALLKRRIAAAAVILFAVFGAISAVVQAVPVLLDIASRKAPASSAP